MTMRWKRWQCPACLMEVEDPEYIYATCCGENHMCILGSVSDSGDGRTVWASLDDHFYTKEQIEELLRRKG